MNSQRQPAHYSPAQPARRPYSAPRLEPLGGIVQMTASTNKGMTPDGADKGMSGS